LKSRKYMKISCFQGDTLHIVDLLVNTLGQ
jgi:hypothetical protein